MVKRAREPSLNKWSLPGGLGALEEEKDPNKAIVLEIYQDLGVKFNCNFYTFSFKEQPGLIIKLIFEGSIKGKPYIKSRETISDIKWFTIDEALNLDLGFEDVKVIKKFKEDFQADFSNRF